MKNILVANLKCQTNLRKDRLAAVVENAEEACARDEAMSQIKEEVKTTGELFDDYEDIEVQASSSQINFEFVGIKEDPTWKECPHDDNEHTPEEAPELTEEIEIKEEITPSVTEVRSDWFYSNFDCDSSKGSDDALLEEDGSNAVQKSKIFECFKCESSFSRKGKLDRHITSVHEKLKPYKCPNCDYACSQKGHLSSHIKAVHNKLKPFKCSICDYECSRRDTLSAHIKLVHEKIKEYKCPICDYACSPKSSLSRHIKAVHEKLKPFKCPNSNCNYACSEKGSLSRHIKFIHETIKPIIRRRTKFM